MDHIIIRRFYSNIEANIYFLQLQDAGIACFLSQENISTILPLADGGVFLNVASDQVEEANELMSKIDLEKEKNKKEENFRDATVEDIYYEKEVVEYNKRLEGGWLNGDIVMVVIFMLFVITIIMIVVNFFFPFTT
jgi:tetrahydromethanopterin S-methyltransferase subunit F